MELLTIGDLHTLLEDVVYALPARSCIFTVQTDSGTVFVSNDNITFFEVVLTGNNFLTSAAFIKVEDDDATIIAKAYTVLNQYNTISVGDVPLEPLDMVLVWVDSPLFHGFPGLVLAQYVAVNIDGVIYSVVGVVVDNIDQNWNIEGLDDLAELSINNLVGVVHTIDIPSTELTVLSLPLLKIVGGKLDISTGAIVSLNLGALETVGLSLVISDASDMAVINLSSLIRVGGDINMSNLDSVGDLDLSALQYVGRNFSVIDSLNLESIDISSLLKAGGAFIASGNALTEAAVDAILVKLASMDGTNGTESYDDHSIDLDGGTNAPPSAVGLAAKTVLEARGNTVNVN